MSVYAFDLDGTLDRPVLAQLANDLFDAGHTVYVVTGGLSDSGEWTAAARRARLERLGVRCTGVLRCLHPDLATIGRLKGEACNKVSADLIIDDDRGYLTGVATSSKVQRLLVL